LENGMTGNPAQRYLADSVNTASPVRLLVMLYDRLVLDLHRAADCQESGDLAGGWDQIRHAQQIVAELRASLRIELWDGADDLAGLYGFMMQELMAVNGSPDPVRLRAVETMAAELRDSWRAAALSLLSPVAPASVVVDTAAETARLGAGSPSAGARSVAWIG
jgi:flagellar protein FliS